MNLEMSKVKGKKIQPIKAWAVLNVNGQIEAALIYNSKEEAEESFDDANFSASLIVPVVITPINTKK